MKAINFKLKSQDDKTYSLDDFKKRWVVLYFYPKDDTPGCTLEGSNFSSRISDFEKLSAAVIGISPDSVDSHRKFCLKHKLGIILLSDPEKKAIMDYGVWKEKSMYGRKYMGVERSTFIISPKGEIAAEWRKVSVPGHVEEVLNRINELRKK